MNATQRATLTRIGTRRGMLLGGASLMGALGVVGVLSACGTPDGAGPAAVSAKPAKIIMRNGASQPVNDFFDQKIFPVYKAKYPQHTMEAEWVTTKLVDTLAVSKAAGTDPDLYWIGANWMSSLALQKLARDITGYIKTWNQEKDYFPGTIQTLWNKKWNIGWVSNCDLYMYRTDWFTEASIPVAPAQFPVNGH